METTLPPPVTSTFLLFVGGLELVVEGEHIAPTGDGPCGALPSVMLCAIESNGDPAEAEAIMEMAGVSQDDVADAWMTAYARVNG